MWDPTEYVVGCCLPAEGRTTISHVGHSSMEALSKMNKAVAGNNLRGSSAAVAEHGSMRVSYLYLLFADDAIIFCNADGTKLK